MREYRARPYLMQGVLMPAKHNDLPCLDVFIIKMLAAPCKFTEQPTAEAMMMTPPAEVSTDRKIAPNMRTGIRKTAESAIGFLENVTLVKSRERADELLDERKSLLESVEQWYDAFEDVQAVGEPRSINDCFLNLLYHILQVVLLETLDCGGRLEAENEKIQTLANEINDRLKDYDMRKGIESGRNE